MHSSWYSRRRIEVTSSGAVAGAKVASLRTPIVDMKIGRNMRHATKLGGSRCIPHIARVIINCERVCRNEGRKKHLYKHQCSLGLRLGRNFQVEIITKITTLRFPRS